MGSGLQKKSQASDLGKDLKQLVNSLGLICEFGPFIAHGNCGANTPGTEWPPAIKIKLAVVISVRFTYCLPDVLAICFLPMWWSRGPSLASNRWEHVFDVNTLAANCWPGDAECESIDICWLVNRLGAGARSRSDTLARDTDEKNIMTGAVVIKCNRRGRFWQMLIGVGTQSFYFFCLSNKIQHGRGSWPWVGRVTWTKGIFLFGLMLQTLLNFMYILMNRHWCVLKQMFSALNLMSN